MVRDSRVHDRSYLGGGEPGDRGVQLEVTTVGRVEPAPPDLTPEGLVEARAQQCAREGRERPSQQVTDEVDPLAGPTLRCCHAVPSRAACLRLASAATRG